MKKILLSLTLILVLVPNIYKAGITDAPNGNTNSKTTVKYTQYKGRNGKTRTTNCFRNSFSIL